MNAKAEIYIPAVFRSFQGFEIRDIKEWQDKRHMELILESKPEREHFCCRCGCELGPQDGRYWLKSRHLKVMGWTVVVCFWREKRFCFMCNKVRSEAIDFICPASPHVTNELAWWISRLTEITSVLAVSELESIDKMTCYRVDKYLLTRLLQGYKIPTVFKISVDEVYARGPVQLKEGENRSDLFLTVIVDIRTHKVIWVSKSRRKQALDEFFILLGDDACKNIKVVATDQHEDYAASVRQYCPNATLVWDRFHLMRIFEEAVNETRKILHAEQEENTELQRLTRGKFRYLFLKKANRRTLEEKTHIDDVLKNNERFAKLELIKERMITFFDQPDAASGLAVFDELATWIAQCGFGPLIHWYRKFEKNWDTVKNYFTYKVTTGVSEGINRAIKGLKWQAYGYKDMDYFKLKILQKCGYLNSQFSLTSDKK
jgi:transposase